MYVHVDFFFFTISLRLENSQCVTRLICASVPFSLFLPLSHFLRLVNCDWLLVVYNPVVFCLVFCLVFCYMGSMCFADQTQLCVY